MPSAVYYDRSSMRAPLVIAGPEVEAQEPSAGRLLELGEQALSAGKAREALGYYQAILAVFPLREALFGAGSALWMLGRYDEAREALEQMQERDPNSPVPFTGLGAIAMLKGDSAQATRLFREALEKDPFSIPARQGLARLLAADHPAEALRLCEEVERIAPNSTAYDECVRGSRAARRGPGTPSP